MRGGGRIGNDPHVSVPESLIAVRGPYGLEEIPVEIGIIVGDEEGFPVHLGRLYVRVAGDQRTW